MPLSYDEIAQLQRAISALEAASESPRAEAGFRGRTHTFADCNRTIAFGGPKNCVVHKPSTRHRLYGSPQMLRSSGLIEDLCEHGVGHPNPDSVAYYDWLYGRPSGLGSHGCDGCCVEIIPEP